MAKFKTIGVLGGMGPNASAYLYQLLLSHSQEFYKAVQDSDYPHIIVNSLALEGSDEFGMEKSDIILNQLIEGVRSLEKTGADFIIIACNSVHNFITEISATVKIPILDIIDEVIKEVKAGNSKKVLVLSSETADKDRLYENALAQESIGVIKPSNELKKMITDLILAVMGGKSDNALLSKVIKEINVMYNSSKIDSVILGCTELPLVIHQRDTSVKVYDSLGILSRAALKYAKN